VFFQTNGKNRVQHELGIWWRNGYTASVQGYEDLNDHDDIAARSMFGIAIGAPDGCGAGQRTGWQKTPESAGTSNAH